ncbi:MAG: hypothetical protein PS018_13120 [bacterium]|nr:hypothetical protein [bacterium]
MQSLTFEIGNYRGRFAGFCVRGFILAALIAFGALLADRPATAGSCGALTGKALYNCVATNLDHKADMIGRVRGDPEAPVAARALQTAASQLRAATSKVQALSAITQARSAISGIIQQAKSGGRDSQGWGRLIGALSQMASLIQKKG